MALLISIRPRFSTLILEGSKTVELRRVRPRIEAKAPVFLYATLPIQAVVGYCLVSRVISQPAEALWKLVETEAGVSLTEFKRYYKGASIAHAIFVERPIAFSRPIALRDLQSGWPEFRPPQSYRYIPPDQFPLFLADQKVRESTHSGAVPSETGCSVPQ